MARIPKQRVIFDAEKYDLDYLRETRDSYSPMTDAEFEDSISYDMGEDDLLDLMEMDWRSNEKALDAFLGKSILVRYSPVNYDDGFVQFNLNDLDDLLHTHTSPLHRVDKVWDEDGHLFFSGKWPDNSPCRGPQADRRWRAGHGRYLGRLPQWRFRRGARDFPRHMGRPRARIHSALCGACAGYARGGGPCPAATRPHHVR